MPCRTPPGGASSKTTLRSETQLAIHSRRDDQEPLEPVSDAVAAAPLRHPSPRHASDLADGAAVLIEDARRAAPGGRERIAGRHLDPHAGREACGAHQILPTGAVRRLPASVPLERYDMRGLVADDLFLQQRRQLEHDVRDAHQPALRVATAEAAAHAAADGKGETVWESRLAPGRGAVPEHRGGELEELVVRGGGGAGHGWSA